MPISSQSFSTPNNSITNQKDDFFFLTSMQWHCWNGKLCTTFCECQWQAVNFLHLFPWNISLYIRLFKEKKWHCFCLIAVLKLKKTSVFLRWNPDAIVFNSSQLYGTPSYWVQRFFTESSGATILDTTLQTNTSLIASAITWQDSNDGNNYLRIKVYFIIIDPCIFF